MQLKCHIETHPITGNTDQVASLQCESIGIAGNNRQYIDKLLRYLTEGNAEKGLCSQFSGLLRMIELACLLVCKLLFNLNGILSPIRANNEIDDGIF